MCDVWSHSRLCEDYLTLQQHLAYRSTVSTYPRQPIINMSSISDKLQSDKYAMDSDRENRDDGEDDLIIAAVGVIVERIYKSRNNKEPEFDDSSNSEGTHNPWNGRVWGSRVICSKKSPWIRFWPRLQTSIYLFYIQESFSYYAGFFRSYSRRPFGFQPYKVENKNEWNWDGKWGISAEVKVMVRLRLLGNGSSLRSLGDAAKMSKETNRLYFAGFCHRICAIYLNYKSDTVLIFQHFCHNGKGAAEVTAVSLFWKIVAEILSKRVFFRENVVLCM